MYKLKINLDFVFTFLIDRGGQVGRAFAPSAEGRGFVPPIRSSQRLKIWHLLLPCVHHLRPRTGLVGPVSV